MAFDLEVGPHAENLAKQMRAAGEQISGRIANRPALTEEDRFYYLAFKHLDSGRVWMPTGGPIIPQSLPWRDVNEYATQHRMSLSEREVFHYVIELLDFEYTKRTIARAKKPAKK